MQLGIALESSAVNLIKQGNITGALDASFSYELYKALDVNPQLAAGSNIRNLIRYPEALREVAKGCGHNTSILHTSKSLTFRIRWLLTVPHCDDMLAKILEVVKDNNVPDITEATVYECWAKWTHDMSQHGLLVFIGARLKISTAVTDAEISKRQVDSAYSCCSCFVVQPLLQSAMMQIIGQTLDQSVDTREIYDAIKKYIETERISLPQVFGGLIEPAKAFAKRLNTLFTGHNLNKTKPGDYPAMKQVIDNAIKDTRIKYDKQINEYENAVRYYNGREGNIIIAQAESEFEGSNTVTSHHSEGNRVGQVTASSSPESTGTLTRRDFPPNRTVSRTRDTEADHT